MNRTLGRGLFALVAVASCRVAAAQQAGSIRGRVVDKDFDTPLAGVVVEIVETRQRATSGDAGNYVLPEVAAGRYTLQFRKEGFQPAVRADVLVAAGQLTDVEASLVGEYTDMDEFLVHDVLQVAATTEFALLQLRLESPALVDAVGSELMSRAGASDAAAALRLVAGATVQNGKSAVIRGLPDRYVSSQLNGVRLPTANEDKRAVELDQFPTEVVESVRVSKTFTPDQQGDASGGAVDVRLKSVPDEPFFCQWKFQRGYDSEAGGRGNFLSYRGGGTNFWGDRRDSGPQTARLGENWDGAVGASRVEAPEDEKWSLAIGGRREVADGVAVGGFVSVFHENSSMFAKDGRDDSWWVESPGAHMTPRTVQGTVSQGDYKTALYDVQRATQTVQWGSLATCGVSTENHRIGIVGLYTRSAEDSVTVAEDTRGKAHFYPGYDPHDPNSPGFYEFNAAPYLRLETLQYTERTTATLQLYGNHRIAAGRSARAAVPEVDWTLAKSRATSDQPDKRQFGSSWTPGFDLGGGVTIPPVYSPYKPSANFTLGNLQRLWKRVDEDSEQGTVSLKVPYELREKRKGWFQTGVFRDRLTRRFDQDTFSNFNDNSSSEGPWEQPWSQTFPYENHPITASTLDVDYRGEQALDAAYAMLDVPFAEHWSLVAGVRYEATSLSIVNDPEANAIWLPPSTNSPTELHPGDADVDYSHDDWLPSVGLSWTPLSGLALRGSYAQTTARQTFKELSPIQQQEYLGGPVFLGNPDLEMSTLRNYDLRVDWSPRAETLLSASWFRKDIDGPIEYVQRISSFDYTTAVNYPSGRIEGWELEARDGLGHWWGALDGMALGANATFLHSRVQLTDEEIAAFRQPNLNVPMTSRDMTNAPDHLYNAFVTYDVAATGSQLGLFYTVTGDTLVAGAGEANGNFVPSVYAVEYGRLNFSFVQKLGDHVRLSFTAKNLTDPERREVYRSSTLDEEVTRRSYREGIDFAVAIGGEIRF